MDHVMRVSVDVAGIPVMFAIVEAAQAVVIEYDEVSRRGDGMFATLDGLVQVLRGALSDLGAACAEVDPSGSAFIPPGVDSQ